MPRAASLLLVVVWQLCSSVSRAQPSIAVVYPENHSSLRVDPLTGTVRFEVGLAIQNFRVPEDGFVHISGEKIGEYEDGFVHAHASPFVRMSDVELGSHFWTFALRDHNGSAVPGASARTTLHIEIVLPQDTKLPQWHYTPTQMQRRPRILFNPPRRAQWPKPDRNRLCLIGSADALFDGQKKMWTQAMGALPQQEWDVHFVAFQDFTEYSPFVEQLHQLNVSIRGAPLIVNVHDVASYGLTASQVMSTTIEALHEMFPNLSHDSISLPTFYRRIGDLYPPFAGRLWQRMVDVLHETCKDAVLVMANSKDIADQLLVTASRIAGVRAVIMEMTNLRPVPLHVDALVAPSHYALQHPSTTDSVTAHQRYVLNTGVDTTRFRPAVVTDRVTFTVGYIGRLATDKSVGLVISVARLLVKSCPITCRVHIIGDGPLREHLESLVAEWEVDGIVHFTGGIYSEPALIREMQLLDVVVSPCFHETLGIAPLEAMSCGIPVVSFSSGGVLEYLEHNVNGLVVHEPTAEALHDAILAVRQDDHLRRRLGRQARRTVVERFNHDVGVQQFVRLYERLAQS